MTDRELLERAARATGLTVRYWAPSGWADIGPINDWWNPLEDDGDALRLAIALRLEIRPGVLAITVAGNGAWAEVTREGNDDAAATRRAIVRAAAQMGER